MAAARLLEMIRLGLHSLRLHLSRSVLTMLGIVFGVGAVVCMLSITQGAREQVLRQISQLGLETITVTSRKPPPDTRVEASRGNIVIGYGLTFEDALRLRQTLPTVEMAVTLRDLRRDAYRGSVRLVGRVAAVEPAYLQSAGLLLEASQGLFILGH